MLLLVNICQIRELRAMYRDRSTIRSYDTPAEQKRHTMRVCNSTVRFSRASDTQNNRLLVFGILSSNTELTKLALNRDLTGATMAGIEYFETIYTTTVMGDVAVTKIDFERPFSRSYVTLPSLAVHMAGARPTVASHAIRSAVVTLCYRDVARRARK